MLALKLLLVPSFLLALSLAGARWGPRVAGWLAGLPVVGGPILGFLAVDHGATFAAAAATASLAAVSASVSFGLAYSHAARHLRWPLALAAGVAAWAFAATLLSVMPASIGLGALAAALALLAGPPLFPHGEAGAEASPVARPLTRTELGARMLAGVVLTLGVTGAAAALGSRWSGLLAVFPVLGIVLAVSTHRRQGGAPAGALLHAMADGLASFAVFCGCLGVALAHTGVAGAFVIAALAAVVAQSLMGERLRRASARRARGVAGR